MHYVQVKGILSAKNGMNLYRGCSHGCIYCDSRSSCYQMPHAFEDIEVKQNALVLLEEAPAAQAQKMYDRHRVDDRSFIFLWKPNSAACGRLWSLFINMAAVLQC